MRGNAGSGMRGRECGECGGMRGRGMRRECGVSLNLVNFLSRIIWLRHTQKHYATTEALRVARCAVPHHPAGRRPSRDFFKRHGSADVSRTPSAESARLRGERLGLVSDDQPRSPHRRARLRGLPERAIAACPRALRAILQRQRSTNGTSVAKPLLRLRPGAGPSLEGARV